MLKQTQGGSPLNSDLEAEFVEDPGGDVVMECAMIARELLDIMLKESVILKRFDSKELLEVLPEKELLLKELERKLKELQTPAKGDAMTAYQTRLLTLKRTLAEIHRTNHLNHVFVQGSLDYWQGLMTVFCPPTYCSGQGVSIRKTTVPPKGFTFSKEI